MHFLWEIGFVLIDTKYCTVMTMSEHLLTGPFLPFLMRAGLGRDREILHMALGVLDSPAHANADLKLNTIDCSFH